MAVQINDFGRYSNSVKIPVKALEKAVKPMLEVDKQMKVFSDSMANISTIASNSMKKAYQYNRIMKIHSSSIENMIANVQPQLAYFSDVQKQIVKNINVVPNAYLANLGRIKNIAEHFSVQNQELYTTIQAALSVLAEHQIKVPKSVIDDLNSELNYSDWQGQSLEYQSPREINLTNIKWRFVLSVLIVLLNMISDSCKFQHLKLKMDNNHLKQSQKIEELKSQIDRKTLPIYSLYVIKKITGKVTLRNKPFLESTPIIELNENDLVQTIEVNNDWLKVVYWDDENTTVHQGWIQSEYCKPVV